MVATAAPVANDPSHVRSAKSIILNEMSTPITMMENINPSTKMPSIIITPLRLQDVRKPGIL
jgi:hypothetical protein